ncbi:hypothetical protein HGB07_03435 [Candidatus Roizmanbacteria bacterium]|nr:hypothetical protein [Candidatus Roizmanbacteria bacterium]
MKIETPPKNHTFTNLTLEKRKWLAYILPLGMWALIQYYLGNRLYALFIIAFFFVVGFHYLFDKEN